jgi:hypothetical protein
MASVSDVRRPAAADAAIVLTGVGVVLVAMGIGAEIGRLLGSAALLALATMAAWYAVTRAGWRRAAGSVALVATSSSSWSSRCSGTARTPRLPSPASPHSSLPMPLGDGRSVETFER